jgi:hypothetical protein
MNTNVNIATKPTRQWGMTEAWFQSQLQNPKHANCNRETGKQEQQKQENKKLVNKK